MAKISKKILEICNNLIMTINKIPKNRVLRPFQNDMFKPPQAKRSELKIKLFNIMKKNKITANDLKPVI